MIGGTTVPLERAGQPAEVAAMEPAAVRQDDSVVPYLGGVVAATAMEPVDQRRDDSPCPASQRRRVAGRNGAAGKRRDDAVNAAIARGLPWVPQWSPPERGGRVRMHKVLTGVTDDVPQESPQPSAGAT